MPALNPFRAEIEQILAANSRTRTAKVLLGMKRGLTDAEMSREASADGIPCKPATIAMRRRMVGLTLSDELVSTKSSAKHQSVMYRELLHYSPSPELHQHIITRLTQLKKLDPSIPLTPLGAVQLGANTKPRPGKPEQPCPDCFTVHAGECQ